MARLPSEWQRRQVSATGGSSLWSGGGTGFGYRPVITWISCFVPLSFALIQPSIPGSTWHSPQVTSRCGPASYAASSEPIWWQRPQKLAVSVHWMRVTLAQMK